MEDARRSHSGLLLHDKVLQSQGAVGEPYQRYSLDGTAAFDGCAVEQIVQYRNSDAAVPQQRTAGAVNNQSGAVDAGEDPPRQHRPQYVRSDRLKRAAAQYVRGGMRHADEFLPRNLQLPLKRATRHPPATAALHQTKLFLDCK